MRSVSPTRSHTHRCVVCSYWWSPTSVECVNGIVACHAHVDVRRLMVRAAERVRSPDYPDGTPAE